MLNECMQALFGCSHAYPEVLVASRYLTCAVFSYKLFHADEPHLEGLYMLWPVNMLRSAVELSS